MTKPVVGSALIVDDSPTQLVDLRMRLARIGFAVQTAGNGREALDAIAEHMPDVVLTDLQMPEMDGLELVRQVASKHPGLPVVLLTAFGSEEIAVKALQNGGAGYVAKKNLARDLHRTLENVLTLVRAARAGQQLVGHIDASAASYELPNDRNLIAPLVARTQTNLVRWRLCDEGQAMRVGLALHEALMNAMEHGNLEVASELKERDDGSYERLVSERRTQAPYAERRVRLTCHESAGEATYVVRDDGRGFDTANLPDPTDPENLLKASGRGLLLIHSFMDEVRHNTAGSEITMIKRCAASA